MNRVKFYYLFPVLVLGMFLSSCKKDDEGNKITIEIEEPTNGENIARADCADVHIHINITATEENHEVEIVLHPEGDGNDKIIDYDAHMHDKVINFEQEVDLCSYPAGTCFHLEVFACVDHDCEKEATAEAEFCIQ